MKPLMQEANGCITAGNGTTVEGFREQDTLRRVFEGEERDKRLVARRKQAALRLAKERERERRSLAMWELAAKEQGPWTTQAFDWAKTRRKPSKLATIPITKGLRPPAEKFLPAAAMFEVWRNHAHYHRVDAPSKTKGDVTLVNLQRQLATPIRNACFSHEFADMLHFWIAFKNFQRVAALQISQIKRSQRAITLEWFFAQHHIIASWRCKLTSVTSP